MYLIRAEALSTQYYSQFNVKSQLLFGNGGISRSDGSCVRGIDMRESGLTESELKADTGRSTMK
jgi:hypothetical protein